MGGGSIGLYDQWTKPQQVVLGRGNTEMGGRAAGSAAPSIAAGAAAGAIWHGTSLEPTAYCVKAWQSAWKQELWQMLPSGARSLNTTSLFRQRFRNARRS